jgi:hypothetical protein
MLATTIGLVACTLVTLALALDWIRHPGDDGLEPGAVPPPARRTRPPTPRAPERGAMTVRERHAESRARSRGGGSVLT